MRNQVLNYAIKALKNKEKTKQGYKQIKQGIRRELFANNEHYLTLQRQNASGTVKYNPPPRWCQ